jgi:hypothetical protein
MILITQCISHCQSQSSQSLRHPYLKKLEDFSAPDFFKDFNDKTMELRSSRALRWQELPAASNMSIWAQNKPSLNRDSDYLSLTEMNKERLLWDASSSQKQIQENKIEGCAYRFLKSISKDPYDSAMNKLACPDQVSKVAIVAGKKILEDASDPLPTVR